ncbi:DUF1192 domain-containing protein [Limoniibacter endophyticus]|uniref:DUF1192 domain-containing protein n=1 Tax=Limoniibacter endophyticus TaxID=1565040 RepID=A0A8J3GIA8_9HYPH|nr:DUF1192 domain-containing protein [Limoniibacter endophyticus]GHC77091.1 hypothetical protein GCM10010136_28370 [Limoniibacter endophyticus]
MEEEAIPVRGSMIGADLSNHSVDDLEAYRDALHAEIVRVNEAISRRGATRNAAEQFFKR